MTYPQVLAVPIPERLPFERRYISEIQNPANAFIDDRMDKTNMQHMDMGSASSLPKDKYENTPEGDGRPFVVELSFDADEAARRDASNRVDQTRDAPLMETRQLSRMAQSRAKHTRDLSAHFFDATRLTDVLEGEMAGLSYPTQNNIPLTDTQQAQAQSEGRFMYMNANSAPPISPAGKTGQKHRRGYSGDFSNPVMAHRRINSIGNSAPVDRTYGYYSGGFQPPAVRPPYGHRREDSTGLDILSAAANVSKEELALAAGRPAPTVTWDHPPETHRHTDSQRMSPSAVSAASYEYPHGPPNRSYHPSYLKSANTGNYHATPAPYHAFYPPGGPPPQPYHQRAANASPYPPQYTTPRGPDNYGKQQYPPQQLIQPQRREGQSRAFDERIDTDERLFDRQQVPAWSDSRNAGVGQGVEPFATPSGAGDGRGINPAPNRRAMGHHQDLIDANNPSFSSAVGHHRKLSSYSSIGTLMNSALFAEPSDATSVHASKKSFGHHRATSSSVSFLQGLEDASDLFLHNLGPPTGVSYQATFSPPSTKNTVASRPIEAKSSVSVVSNSQGSGKSLAEGGTSKRVRRKCTVANCPNRVVQGGLCISHGARRKICNHPGCDKNVKKAGLCSTHGPARRRCDVGGCGKVAVQGGRCIAHGAKKKLCTMEGCCKQAILTGMCKKHHDLGQGIPYVRSARGKREDDDDDDDDEDDEESNCVQVASKPPPSKAKTPSHHRGLSIFQEISAESVQTLLAHNEESGGVHPLM